MMLAPFISPRLKFAANLSILFKDDPFLDRFERAARAGFDAVEFWWPSGENLIEVEAAARGAGVQVVMFNLDAGDMPAGDRGLLSDPKRYQQFRDNVPVALEFAQRLGCRQVNALVGVRCPDLTTEAQLELASENVHWAAQQASSVGVRILIEAVNTFENGPYLLSSTEQAMTFVSGVGADNVWLQYDVYHMQRMEGNLSDTLRRHRARIAHIQIADSPARGEPGTGEVNFAYLFTVLDEINYDGYIGLEYVPTTGRTEDTLGWLAAAAGQEGPKHGG